MNNWNIKSSEKATWVNHGIKNKSNQQGFYLPVAIKLINVKQFNFLKILWAAP